MNLTSYHCDDVAPKTVNPRTGLPCRALLIEAYAPDGAVVRRRCKQCGAWKVITIEADLRESAALAHGLLD